VQAKRGILSRKYLCRRCGGELELGAKLDFASSAGILLILLQASARVAVKPLVVKKLVSFRFRKSSSIR
jgi:hypothetical protein